MSRATSGATRHKWTPLRKTYGSDESLCERCKLEKIGRFSGGQHWTEWRRDGAYIQSAKTPPCLIVEQIGTVKISTPPLERIEP